MEKMRAVLDFVKDNYEYIILLVVIILVIYMFLGDPLNLFKKFKHFYIAT